LHLYTQATESRCEVCTCRRLAAFDRRLGNAGDAAAGPTGASLFGGDAELSSTFTLVVALEITSLLPRPVRAVRLIGTRNSNVWSLEGGRRISLVRCRRRAARPARYRPPFDSVLSPGSVLAAVAAMSRFYAVERGTIAPGGAAACWSSSLWGCSSGLASLKSASLYVWSPSPVARAHPVKQRLVERGDSMRARTWSLSLVQKNGKVVFPSP